MVRNLFKKQQTLNENTSGINMGPDSFSVNSSSLAQQTFFDSGSHDDL